MKKTTLFNASLLTAIAITGSMTAFSQSWSLTGNAGTNPPTNFLGTTDNRSLIIKTNNQQRVAITSFQYGGLEAGSVALPSYISIQGKDVVDTIMPFTISSNILNQTWGNTAGRTMGRLVRFNQGPSVAFGGTNWYDLGIGQDTCFFITNHTVQPAIGNGAIRKRMIVISPQDRVGINLPGTDAIGTGAVPTANFHTNGTVRLQNLPSGTGSILVIDNNGNVFRSSSSARQDGNSSEQEAELTSLKKEVEELKAIINAMKGGFVRIATADESQLLQNAPNPFSKSTTIKYALPGSFQQAFLKITDMNGKTVKTFNVANNANKAITIADGDLAAGTYFYSLIVDGKTIDTKKMVLTR